MIKTTFCLYWLDIFLDSAIFAKKNDIKLH